ncbi:hypothetical protein ACFX5E_04810 [Flavobacterium sp. LS2P90]|uniref:Uncharacterized protein n=1 Tax=Flavobacterium xylosi TaxID=3230415 RepID=A0ABW6HTR7_9FLAO
MRLILPFIEIKPIVGVQIISSVFNIKSIVELIFPFKANVPEIVTVPMSWVFIATLSDVGLLTDMVFPD